MVSGVEIAIHTCIWYCLVLLFLPRLWMSGMIYVNFLADLKNGDKIYMNINLFITWYLWTSSTNQAMFCWSSNLSIDLFSGCSALLLVQPHHHVIFVWLFLLLPIISVFCSKFIRYLLVLIVFAAVGVDMQNCCHSSLCIPSPCLVRFLGQD